MLEIRVNDIPLEIAPDTDVQITASNPILDKDGIERIFSFPFRIPATPNNRRARLHRNRLDSYETAKAQPGSLTFQSNRLVTGFVEQTSFSAATEEIVCVNRPMKVLDRLGKIRIYEILDKIDLTAGRPAPAWKFGMGFVGTYQIDISGNHFSANASSFPNIPVAGASLVAAINAVFPGLASYETIGNNLVLDGVLMEAQTLESYVLLTLNTVNNLAASHYSNMKAHFNAVNATPVASHCFPVIRWVDFYNGKMMMADPFINAAWNGVFRDNVRYQSDIDIWQNTVIPFVKIPYIFSKIAAALGTHSFAGDVLNLPEFQALVLPSNYAMDQVIKSQFEDLLLYKLNCFKSEIDLNKHVPKMTAAEFIQFIRDTFSLSMTISETQIEFKSNKARLAIPATNIGAEISVDYTVATNRADGWKLSHLKNEQEKVDIPAQFTGIVVDGGEKEFQIRQSFYSGEFLLYGMGKFPYTHQPGVSNVFDVSSTSSTLPPTLLFFWGNHLTLAGASYAFASYDNRNYLGKYLGAYTLDISGPDGLYNQWHQGVIETSVADTITTTAYLTIGQLQKLLTWSSARLRFYHPEGAVTGILKSIQASLKTGWRIVAKLEILRP